jgi:hypothetical protein
VRFPKTIRHRKAECKIYGKSKHYPAYRLAWRINGKRHMKPFDTYSDARNAADQLVKDLAKSSQVAAPSPSQARDASAAFEGYSKAILQTQAKNSQINRAPNQRMGSKRNYLRSMPTIGPCISKRQPDRTAGWGPKSFR